MPEGRRPRVDTDRRGMGIKRAATNQTRLGESGKFTGQVWLDALHPTSEVPDGEPAGPGHHVYRVHFEPGARTYWHSHPQGQVLYILSGRGRVGDESGVDEVLPGDAVHTAAGHVHWHGAAPDDTVVHLAISGAGESTWNGCVTDEQYLQTPAALGVRDLAAVRPHLSNRAYEEMRDTWADYEKRQEFEHALIDRKTTWLLTTQGLLFAAFGLTFDAAPTAPNVDSFRGIVAAAGLLTATVALIGVIGLVNAKRMSWKAYREFFEKTTPRELPRPLDRAPLEWGVRTTNTWFVLAPDVFLPLLFVLLWIVVSATR